MKVGIGHPSQLKNLSSLYRQHIRARREQLENKSDVRRESIRVHYANINDIERHGQNPKEVNHLLIDYRNGNRVLAKRCMDRKTAFELNKRMRGSGFGWAVKTGY